MRHNTVERTSHMPRPCFSSACASEVHWGVTSSVAKTNPDGSPLTLYACDVHEPSLTARLRVAGTRYTLFPVSEPTPAPSPPPLEPATTSPSLLPSVPDQIDIDNATFMLRVNAMPFPSKALIKGTIAVVMVSIAPFIIIYYFIRRFLGWRPND